MPRWCKSRLTLARTPMRSCERTREANDAYSRERASSRRYDRGGFAMRDEGKTRGKKKRNENGKDVTRQDVVTSTVRDFSYSLSRAIRPVFSLSLTVGFPFYVKEISQPRRCSRVWGEQWRNNNVKAEWCDLNETRASRGSSLSSSLFSRVTNDTNNPRGPIHAVARENLRVASSDENTCCSWTLELPREIYTRRVTVCTCVRMNECLSGFPGGNVNFQSRVPPNSPRPSLLLQFSLLIWASPILALSLSEGRDYNLLHQCKVQFCSYIHLWRDFPRGTKR